MNSFLRNTFWWIGLLLLQMTLIFYFRPTMVYTPYIYLLLLLRIPNSFPRIGFLFVAFLTGLLIDTFTNSWGIHAFSAVFIAFSLPTLISLFSEQNLTEKAIFSPQSMGGLRYGLVLFLIFLFYHTLVLLLWNFSFHLIFHQLLKALISSVFAWLIIILIHIIFKSKAEESDG